MDKFFKQVLYLDKGTKVVHNVSMNISAKKDNTRGECRNYGHMQRVVGCKFHWRIELKSYISLNG